LCNQWTINRSHVYQSVEITPMPLTPVGPRRELHTRRITCQGFEREDGLWDIEAHLVDTRGYTYTTPERGEMRPGMAGHDMWLRWTLDRDMVIRAIEVVSDATPYPSSCPKAAVSYQKLVGLNVGKGFLKAAQERIGRDESCTHLHTLIQAAANSSMQTIAGSLWEGNSGGAKTDKLFGGVQGSGKPALLGSCRTYQPDNPVVARMWPAHYTGPRSGSE
jgi:hypothetical protein